ELRHAGTECRVHPRERRLRLGRFHNSECGLLELQQTDVGAVFNLHLETAANAQPANGRWSEGKDNSFLNLAESGAQFTEDRLLGAPAREPALPRFEHDEQR